MPKRRRGFRVRPYSSPTAHAEVGFVETFGLYDVGQREAAAALAQTIVASGVEVVRLGFVDLHGIVRGKTIVASELAGALENGYRITTTLLLKDTSHRTVYSVFTPGAGLDMPEMQFAGDMTMVPDPATFRILPWAPHSASLLCDLYFQNGAPVPFSTRTIMKRALADLAAAGYDYVAGLEVEFHLFRVTNPNRTLADAGQPSTPPDVEFLSHGYNYLTELRYDQLDPVFEIMRKDLQALALPLRSLEVEFGPGQCEFTFGTQTGIAAADAMVLLRGAVKQIATRHGYHATFMCRPKIPNVFSSGWHLHQSFTDRATGANAFATPSGSPDLLSACGRHVLGGLLAHARASTPFSTPTINGYRRYRTHSLAPDRVAWGAENKAAMVRVCGEPGNPITHLENRVGEPAANPYLYMASQIVSGLDGLREQRDPGASADVPYETPAPMLPTSLEKALDVLDGDAFYRSAFGDVFIDYFVHIKRAEIARFQLEVSEWEQREYFDLF